MFGTHYDISLMDEKAKIILIHPFDEGPGRNLHSIFTCTNRILLQIAAISRTRINVLSSPIPDIFNERHYLPRTIQHFTLAAQNGVAFDPVCILRQSSAPNTLVLENWQWELYDKINKFAIPVGPVHYDAFTCHNTNGDFRSYASSRAT